MVHNTKQSGDVDLHGAVIHTVLTGSTRNTRSLVEDFNYFIDHLALVIGQPLEVFHVGNVVIQLSLIAHTGQNSDHAVQRCSITDSPRGNGSFRIESFELSFDLFRHNSQGTTLYRLHNDNRHIVLSCYFIALTRLNAFALPVSVVDLQLYKFSFRMARQDLIQSICAIMEREAGMFNQAFFLHFLHELPATGLFCLFAGLTVQSMQQIEIEVTCLSTLQRGIKDGLIISILFDRMQRHLGSQLERLTGITFYNSITNCFLRLTIHVNICGIKVSKTFFHVLVYHFAGLLQINLFTVHGKTHKAKTQFFDFFT